MYSYPASLVNKNEILSYDVNNLIRLYVPNQQEDFDQYAIPSEIMVFPKIW